MILVSTSIENYLSYSSFNSFFSNCFSYFFSSFNITTIFDF